MCTKNIIRMAGLFRIETCLCRESSFDRQRKGSMETSRVSRIRPGHTGRIRRRSCKSKLFCRVQGLVDGNGVIKIQGDGKDTRTIRGLAEFVRSSVTNQWSGNFDDRFLQELSGGFPTTSYILLPSCVWCYRCLQFNYGKPSTVFSILVQFDRFRNTRDHQRRPMTQASTPYPYGHENT